MTGLVEKISAFLLERDDAIRGDAPDATERQNSAEAIAAMIASAPPQEGVRETIATLAAELAGYGRAQGDLEVSSRADAILSSLRGTRLEPDHLPSAAVRPDQPSVQPR